MNIVKRAHLALAGAFAAGLALLTRSSSSAAATGPGSGARFGEALVQRAREDLGRGVVETGKNSGPIVDQYLRNVGASPGQNWCAAAAWTWIRDAAERAGAKLVLQVVKRTGGAKAVADGPKKVGWYMPAAVARAIPQSQLAELIPPGSVSIWDRSDPPHTSWQGHIGVLEEWGADFRWKSLEGNSGPVGDRVARMDRSLDNDRLEGFIIWPKEVS